MKNIPTIFNDYNFYEEINPCIKCKSNDVHVYTRKDMNNITSIYVRCNKCNCQTESINIGRIPKYNDYINAAEILINKWNNEINLNGY